MNFLSLASRKYDGLDAVSWCGISFQILGIQPSIFSSFLLSSHPGCFQRVVFLIKTLIERVQRKLARKFRFRKISGWLSREIETSISSSNSLYSHFPSSHIHFKYLIAFLGFRVTKKEYGDLTSERSIAKQLNQ